MGSFSEKLLSLQKGDELTTSAPYGFFYPEPEEVTPLIFVVGGIGITPCLSIIKTLLQAHDQRLIQLAYSNRSEEEIIFRKQLDELTLQHKNFSVRYFVTRKEPTDTTKIFGRMAPEALVTPAILKLNPEFFICGSIDFTRALWKGISRCGVPHYRLYTEGFF
jgi:ferredoxin-NADP reductase